MTDTIVTISRQYGSGGRDIGRRLAERMGVPFYDQELITGAAKKSGYAESLFIQAEQKPTGSLLYSLSMLGTNRISYELPLSDRLFLIQSEVIRETAEQGGCVIVGRCADYVLRDHPNCVNVFISGDFEDRVRRAIQSGEVSEEKARENVLRMDKRRATYYNYYTSMKFGGADHYHLCLNSSCLGWDGAADLIYRFLELRKQPDAQAR